MNQHQIKNAHIQLNLLAGWSLHRDVQRTREEVEEAHSAVSYALRQIEVDEDSEEPDLADLLGEPLDPDGTWPPADGEDE